MTNFHREPAWAQSWGRGGGWNPSASLRIWDMQSKHQRMEKSKIPNMRVQLCMVMGLGKDFSDTRTRQEGAWNTPGAGAVTL